MTDRLTKQAIVDLIISHEADIEFTSALHPKNAAQQKKKFFAEEIENPTFTYQAVEVPSIEFPELDPSIALYDLYQDRMHHTVVLGELLQAVGNDEQFATVSNVVFPFQEIVLPALSYQKIKNDSPLLNAQDIQEKFEQALINLALPEWCVKIERGISSRMYVNQWDQHIGIRADVQANAQEVNRLIQHEIGVHVLRAANGCKQTEPLLHVGTLKGRLFEEGVACYIEQPEGPWRIFFRHYAVQLAKSSSFRKVWQGLVAKGVSPQVAWSMTVRVKRGFVDTSAPGAFTRDAMYAQAFMEMKQYVQHGGSIVPLLSAPIHPNEIERLQQEASMKIFSDVVL